MALPDFVLSAAGVLFTRLLGAATQFVFYLVVAQRFGAEGLGLFVLAFTSSIAASTVSCWGIDQVALRHLSGHHAHGEFAAFRALFAHSIALVLLISTSIALAMGLLSGPIAMQIFGKPELAPILRMLAFSIVPFSLLQLLGESVRATGRVVLSAVLQTALAPVLALAFISLAPSQDAVGSAALYYTLAYFAAMVAAIFFQSPRTSPLAVPDGKSENLSPWQLLKTATPVAWVTIFSVWLGFSETLLLGLYRAADEVGYYAASLRLVLLVNFLLVALNGALAPKFAVLHRQGEIRELISLARRATLVMLTLSCPIFLALFLLPEILLAWFGDEFTAASTALVILAVGQLVNIATGPVGIILLMTGNAPAMQRHLVITVLVNLALAFLLIPPFGIVGAACSAAAAMAVLNLLLLHSVYHIFSEAPRNGPGCG